MSAHHKEMKELQNTAQQNGWEIERTKSNKLCWKLQDALFYSAPTPHDHRAIQNIRANLRRIEKARRG